MDLTPYSVGSWGGAANLTTLAVAFIGLVTNIISYLFFRFSYRRTESHYRALLEAKERRLRQLKSSNDQLEIEVKNLRLDNASIVWGVFRNSQMKDECDANITILESWFLRNKDSISKIAEALSLDQLDHATRGLNIPSREKCVAFAIISALVNSNSERSPQLLRQVDETIVLPDSMSISYMFRFSSNFLRQNEVYSNIDDAAAIITIWIKQFRDLRSAGFIKEALDLAWSAAHLAETSLPIERYERFDAIDSLVDALANASFFEEAELYARKEIDLVEKCFEENGICHTRALRTLGYVLYTRKKYIEARVHLEKAFKITSKLENKTELSRICNDLGILYQDIGELDKAELLLKQSMGLENDPMERATTMRNLAHVHWARGERSEARSEIRKALGVWESASIHTNAAICLSDLGQLSYQDGNFVESRHYLWKALEFAAQSFGPNHLETARILTRFGNTLTALGLEFNAAEALTLARKTVLFIGAQE